jgi:hypothetical protein
MGRQQLDAETCKGDVESESVRANSSQQCLCEAEAIWPQSENISKLSDEAEVVSISLQTAHVALDGHTPRSSEPIEELHRSLKRSGKIVQLPNSCGLFT